MEMNARICAIATVFSGNTLTDASADRTELFTNQQTAERGAPLEMSQKNGNDRFRQENLPWLAKVNYFCSFGSKIMLQRVDSDLLSKPLQKYPLLSLKL
jgi:hypothetical protein